jgi:hypothetical protein
VDAPTHQAENEKGYNHSSLREGVGILPKTVARRPKISWNTAQVHLYKLLADGKIKGKRVGRQNQWALR